MTNKPEGKQSFDKEFEKNGTNERIRLGEVSYNYRTGRVCPADWLFLLLTLSVIVIPTALAFYVILANE